MGKPLLGADEVIKLVVVDDDDAGRRMLRRVLERRGFAVEEASDGVSGLELVRRTMPKAALLDLRMPGGMSGLDVARELRADPSTSVIAIVIITASVHDQARSLVEEVGASGFVEKPIDFAELYRVVDAALASSTTGA